MKGTFSHDNMAPIKQPVLGNGSIPISHDQTRELGGSYFMDHLYFADRSIVGNTLYQIPNEMINLNSLAPKRCNNFKSAISEDMLWIKFMSGSCETEMGCLWS